MASKSRGFLHWTRAASALAAAIAVGWPCAPLAAPEWVKDALSLGHPAAPAIARYAIDEGGEFTLDRSNHLTLLKFDDSPEVWALVPSHGPRGDIIYKNDVGTAFLRSTKMGGMTVFTPKRPQGSAAALVGQGSPLRLAAMGPVALYQRLLQASVRCSRLGRHTISFEAPDSDVRSAALFADAAAVVVNAMLYLASAPPSRATLGRVGKVLFAAGPQPNAYLTHGVLVILVTPAAGVAGRPSSMRIVQAINP